MDGELEHIMPPVTTMTGAEALKVLRNVLDHFSFTVPVVLS